MVVKNTKGEEKNVSTLLGDKDEVSYHVDGIINGGKNYQSAKGRHLQT